MAPAPLAMVMPAMLTVPAWGLKTGSPPYVGKLNVTVSVVWLLDGAMPPIQLAAVAHSVELLPFQA